MKHLQTASRCLLCVSLIMCAAGLASAQDETNTEITGFYQQYTNFSYNTGAGAIGFSGIDIADTKLTGGGVIVAQTLAPWFAIWTQLSVYGTAESPQLSTRIINNLFGIRYQTGMYGPFRLYGRGGLGYSHFGIDSTIFGSGGNSKLSASYGGGVQIWPHQNFGVTLDLSHTTMGLPNLTDLDTRDKWDSGLVWTGGVSVRF